MSFVFSGELSCFHCEEKHFVFRKFIEYYQDNNLKHTQNAQNWASRRLMIFIVDVLLPWQQQASLQCLCTPVRRRRGPQGKPFRYEERSGTRASKTHVLLHGVRETEAPAGGALERGQRSGDCVQTVTVSGGRPLPPSLTNASR